MADHVVVATNSADSVAVDDIRSRYAELLGRQAALGAAVFSAIGTAGPTFDDAHRAALAFIDRVIRPHLRAGVEAVYPAAAGIERARLLVEGLLGETQLAEQAAARITRDNDRIQIAAHLEALRVLLEAILGKVGDLLLPVLAETSDISLADIATKIPGPAPAAADPAGHAHGHPGHDHGHHHGGDPGEEPELDVREVPHSIRHATVFGAFDAVPTGGSMILVAPHDPIPLLQQLAERSDGRIAVSYEQRGPDAWRLRLTRV